MNSFLAGVVRFFVMTPVEREEKITVVPNGVQVISKQTPPNYV